MTRGAGRPSRRSGGGAHRRPKEGPGLWRWPVLVLVLLAAVGGVVVQRHRDDNPPAATAVDVAGLAPVAPAADALGSTWYCAGGTATGTKDGVAEQSIEVVNAGDQAVTAKVTVTGSEGQQAVKELPVPAQGRADLAVSTVLKAAYAAVIVEVPGGRVAVSHLVQGPTGKSTAACSSAPSSNWYLPSGTSRAGTRQLLAVFNPFPSDAVFGLSFATDDGIRTPQKWEGVVLPGQHVTLLDISAVVTLRSQIATELTVRSGRVVVDQIQTADGTNGTTTSLALTPGAPKAGSTWWFADGPAGEGQATSIVVQNPNDDPADVQLQVRLDDAAANGTVAPLEATVPPHQYSAFDLSTAGQLPQGIGYTAVAQSVNGVPIVAQRTVTSAAPASPTGMTTMVGSPVEAQDWIVPVASGPFISAATVVVTNPSSTDPVTVTVATVAGGATTPLNGASGVQILPGGRGGFTVPTGAKSAEVAVEVTSDQPVVVETRISFVTGGLAQPLAVPVVTSAVAATTGIPTAPPGEVVPGVGDGGTVPAAPDGTDTGPAGTSAPSSTPPAGANPGG